MHTFDPTLFPNVSPADRRPAHRVSAKVVAESSYWSCGVLRFLLVCDDERGGRFAVDQLASVYGGDGRSIAYAPDGRWAWAHGFVPLHVGTAFTVNIEPLSLRAQPLSRPWPEVTGTS